MKSSIGKYGLILSAISLILSSLAVLTVFADSGNGVDVDTRTPLVTPSRSLSVTAVSSSDINLQPSSTPLPEPGFQSAPVLAGTPLYDYALQHCRGDRFDEIYRLKSGGDFGRAVFERLPEDLNLIHGARMPGRKKRQAQSTQPALVNQMSPKQGSLIAAEEEPEPVASVLLLLDSGEVHVPRVLPYFYFDRYVRIGLCGLDWRFVGTEASGSTGSMINSRLNSVPTMTALPTATVSGVPPAALPVEPAARPARAEISVFADENSIMPDIGTPITSFFHLDNAQLILQNIHINGNAWPSYLYPFFPDKGHIIGDNVRLTRTEPNDEDHFGLMQTNETIIEFTNSEFEFGLNRVGLLLINGGRISVTDSLFRIRGNRAIAISVYSDASAHIENVIFDSYDPDSSPVAYEGTSGNNQSLFMKNCVFRGRFDPALRIVNNNIMPGSSHNDYSQATGQRCRHRGITGMVEFLDNISCPEQTPPASPVPPSQPASETPDTSDTASPGQTVATTTTDNAAGHLRASTLLIGTIITGVMAVFGFNLHLSDKNSN